MIEPVLDARALDRMVDGELSPDEERSLLLRLEDEPQGWRQLALAFVEARVWRRELLADGVAAGGPPAADHARVSGERRSTPFPAPAAASRRSPTVAGGATGTAAGRAAARHRSALALMVVLAFASGLAAGRASFGRGGLSEQQAGGDSPSAPGPSAGGSPSTFAPDEQMASAAGTGNALPAPQEQTTLRVVFEEPESGEAVPMDVPLVEAAQLGLDWSGPAAALPDDLRHRLEEAGHAIQETRNWYPVQLSDGRQVLLPVDHVQVQYAAERTYQ